MTEILIPEAEDWVRDADEDGNDKEVEGRRYGGVNLRGPLAGIPVSLKDSITVGGFDTSVGYSVNTGTPAGEDGTLVKVLKAAGECQLQLVHSPVNAMHYSSIQLDFENMSK